MSFPQDARRRRVGAGTGFSSSGRRTALGYWVPLALTVGVAAAGVAAWIWSERIEDEEDDANDPRGDDGFPAPGHGGDELPPGYDGDYARSTATDIHDTDDVSMVARMQGALRRTPSPQQILDGASKRMAAGMAAAGAFVGGALTSIREEDRGDFEDHSRWSEEVESRDRRDLPAPATPTVSGTLPGPGVAAGTSSGTKKKKTVAIVVSSDTSRLDPEEYTSDHAVSDSVPFS